MRLPVLLLAALASVVAASGAPAASAAPHQQGPSVSILATAFGSLKVDVLAGDTVTWHNDSVRAHTVSAVDGSFDSARLGVATSFAHKFSAAGVVAYYCQIHPFMRAEVDVHRLMLDAPHNAGAPGQPLAITGRAALPAGTAVTIKAADGSVAGSATVSNGGAFSATVRPRVSTSYTAIAGADASPPVQVLVLDRKVKASAKRAHRGRAVVRTRVVPGAPGATVVLQLHLKQRFGWWPVRHARLDHHSRARFVVRVSHTVRARVVLTAADGMTPLTRSAVLKLRPR